MRGSPLDDAAFLTADAEEGVAPRFRGSAPLHAPRDEVLSATLWATAQGVYEATVDGVPVTESVLNPGWTSYEWRLAYQAFDVSTIVRSGHGDLEVSLLVGNGWWRGRLGFGDANASYGDRIAVAAMLEIEFRDGRRQRVSTSPDWRATASDITRNSLYKGQTVDARIREDEQVLAVRTVEVDRRTLEPQAAPPILRHETLALRRVWHSPSGRLLIDFGQNLVGWLRFTVRGRRGDVIRIRHAEVLEDGELGTRPLRHADAMDELILSGGDDVFEPTFTFHGFRYVEVEGWPVELHPEDLEAVVVHSEMARTGHFRCSDDLVNQLVENAVWSQRGNFLSVPTDCPQRDERLGWTGDIAAYAASASFPFDTADFLGSWLRDLRLETEHAPNRAVPFVVPAVLKYANFPAGHFDGWSGPTAIWGDAAVWVPQALWHAYGDRERLAEHYPAMVLHLTSIEPLISERGLWEHGNQFGDWLDPDAPPESPEAAKADPAVVATACLYRSATFAAEAAAELGEQTDAARWRALAERTRAAFLRHYVQSDGRIHSDCATVYALAITFDVLEGDVRDRAADRLVALVRESGYRVTTGFAGTPFVTWALSETGHVEDAYRLLLERECPSWLYPVTMGATSVWERWDSMLPDGSINPGEMTSFNHYALGAVVDWVHQVVGGLRPASPGYARVRVEPRPGPGIDWAETSLHTRLGHVSVAWRMTDGQLDLEVALPDGLSADIALPDGRVIEVDGGGHTFTSRV
ncbi:family 78 glycoside hydrolase catalytic domain [Microbacterium sp. NPDC077663]|uniref:alpha-L-rhamnosidase n=1 Tax=Microbacterium sp. NPDC077663 TaxID=3364189 RepID=UPI0037C6EF72